MKPHDAMTDLELPEHAVKAGGDGWHLSKALGKNFKTPYMWRSRKKLPADVRKFVLHLLATGTLRCTCKPGVKCIIFAHHPQGGKGQPAGPGAAHRIPGGGGPRDRPGE